MKIAIWFLSIALACSLYMNHVLAARIAVMQTTISLFIPR